MRTEQAQKIADENPQLVSEAREWVAECSWEDETEELDDAEIVVGVDRHYAGGWAQFVADGAVPVQGSGR